MNVVRVAYLVHSPLIRYIAFCSVSTMRKHMNRALLLLLLLARQSTSPLCQFQWILFESCYRLPLPFPLSLLFSLLLCHFYFEANNRKGEQRLITKVILCDDGFSSKEASNTECFQVCINSITVTMWWLSWLQLNSHRLQNDTLNKRKKFAYFFDITKTLSPAHTFTANSFGKLFCMQLASNL